MAAGYQPIPVVSRTKRPRSTEWRAIRGEPSYDPGALSTGLLCDGLRVVDLDVDEPMAAQAALSIARHYLGNAPIRRRRLSCRALLVYAASEGSPRKVRLDLPGLGEGQAVEVLGAGQQCVAFGQHPDGDHYLWPDASPLDTPLDELPRITEAQIAEMLDAVRARFPDPIADIRCR